MASQGAINYQQNLFEIKELRGIAGEPVADNVIQLRRQLGQNAARVSSTLGGGRHGHAGLVYTLTQYATFSNVPYVRPVMPVLTIPANATASQSTMLYRIYDEDLRVFRESDGVEKALFQQLVEAVEPQYLTAVRNRTTNSITMSLSDVLQHLQETYGTITPQMLQTKKASVDNMRYNVHLPIDNVFETVEELVQYAIYAKDPLTPTQTVTYGYLLLLNTGRFATSITEWNRRTDAERDWAQFQTFFRQAHLELRATSNLTIEQAQLQEQRVQQEQQQANIVEQVLAELLIHQESPIIAPAPVANQVHEADIAQALAMQAANAASQQPLTALQAQLQAMQTMMQQMQNNMGNQRRNNNRSSGGSNRNGDTTKYCWTHGGCAHLGIECRTKATGHKDAATRGNKMGGSTRNIVV